MFTGNEILIIIAGSILGGFLMGLGVMSWLVNREEYWR